jgi:glucokinase
MVAVAPNLGWRDAPLGALLTERLKTQVTLSNDLSAAAWGEFKYGAGRGEADVYTVFVGTGVGSAIIVQGRLLHGASGVAGELGHTKIVRDGRRCGCGQQGCLEAYAGGAGLQAWMSEEGLRGTPTDLERLAAEGSTKAKALFDFVAENLGVAVANQVTVLNPGRLVLGGGVLKNAPALLRVVVETVKSRAAARAVARVTVAEAALGDDSGLIGAAMLANG